MTGLTNGARPSQPTDMIGDRQKANHQSPSSPISVECANRLSSAAWPVHGKKDRGMMTMEEECDDLSLSPSLSFVSAFLSSLSLPLTLSYLLSNVPQKDHSIIPHVCHRELSSPSSDGSTRLWVSSMPMATAVVVGISTRIQSSMGQLHAVGMSQRMLALMSLCMVLHSRCGFLRFLHTGLTCDRALWR